jgi:hypothetical protein
MHPLPGGDAELFEGGSVRGPVGLDEIGRWSESVSASVPSRSKSRARYKALAPV